MIIHSYTYIHIYIHTYTYIYIYLGTVPILCYLGELEMGAVWVARKVPDGFVSAHANQARITTFPRNEPDNTLFSSDVVTFAKKMGLYPEAQSDADFSFSDVYDPVTFSGARYCEVRYIWWYCN